MKAPEVLHPRFPGEEPSLDDAALAASPFLLDTEAIGWVKKTLAGLSEQEKLRQLFCEASTSDDPEQARALARQQLGGLGRGEGEGNAGQHGRPAIVPALADAD